MKAKNWIRLLSVLLCAVLLLASCTSGDSDAGAGTDTGTDAVGTEVPGGTGAQGGTETEADSAAQPVEPVLKNFFTLTGTQTWKEMKKLTRMEGECVSESGDLLVFKTERLDTMNKVNEIFTVYNAKLQKTVLTLNNTYEYNEHYATFQWNDPENIRDMKALYPAQVMEVNVHTNGSYGMDISYIKVATAKITPMDEEIWEANNEEGNSHIVETLYTYYDASGAKMAQAKPDHVNRSSNYATTMHFGNTAVTFNRDGLMIAALNADNQVIRDGFDAETETYGYYLDQREDSALGGEKKFFEVYSKKDSSRVMRYYLNSCDKGTAFMLENGDVLVQEISEVEEDGLPYDAILPSHLMMSIFLPGAPTGKVTVNSYIVKMPTGEVTSIELDYLLGILTDRGTMEATMDNQINGIQLTENVINLGLGFPLIKEQLEMKLEVLVLNNDGGLMFKLDRIVPEHCIGYHNLMGIINSADPFGFVVLPSGDYLVQLDNGKRAIASADQRVRCYLPDDASIVGGYVVTDAGIFDYDLNLLCEFGLYDLTLEFVIGDKIVTSKVVSGPEGTTTQYFEVYKGANSFETLQIFADMTIAQKDVQRDYVILLDSVSSKYVMYNAKLAHILTSETNIEVRLLDKYYLLKTEVNDPSEPTPIKVYYTVES